MKDKLVRTSFDQDAFEVRMHDHWLGYVGELDRCSDKKSEIFIEVNYFHSVLDDAMEFLLKTNQGRGFQPKKVIRIMFERGVLSEKEAKVAIKINQIRNIFAHEYDTPKIESSAENIINKIELVFPEPNIISDSVNEWNMYQRLNHIVFSMTQDISMKIMKIKF